MVGRGQARTPKMQRPRLSESPAATSPNMVVIEYNQLLVMCSQVGRPNQTI